MSDKFLWVEKYAPKTVEDCILPGVVKDVFNGFLKQGEIPNMLLCGTGGIGKTCVAKALCSELGVSYITINGSDEGRFLDTVRGKIRDFATTRSLTNKGKHKVIIIDEADNTTEDVQLALRAAIEEFQDACRFIMTCNYVDKIREPLHSRCTVIDFNVAGSRNELLGQIAKRLSVILDENNVEYDRRVLAKLVVKYDPDLRRLIHELQRHSASGKINTDILVTIPDSSVQSLMTALKEKKYTVCQRWVCDNLNNDPTTIFRMLYDELRNHLEHPSVPEATLIIGNWSRDIKEVPDVEISIMCCLTEIMMSCRFK